MIKSPCRKCNSRYECMFICEDLEQLLPSVYAGDKPNKVSFDFLVPVNISRSLKVRAEDLISLNAYNEMNCSEDYQIRLRSLLDYIYDNMEQLTPRQKEILSMRTEGNSWAEIANCLNLKSRGSIKILYDRAIQNLKGNLSANLATVNA